MTSRIPRLLRHLSMPRWRVHRFFPARLMVQIEDEIRRHRIAHDAELCFVVEGALPARSVLQGQSARDRAIELFSSLRLWDTEDNSGVLIYLLLADRAVEIVADRGIHAEIGEAGWEAVCQRFKEVMLTDGGTQAALVGIREVAASLARRKRLKPQ